jgi:hypothetical protein
VQKSNAQHSSNPSQVIGIGRLNLFNIIDIKIQKNAMIFKDKKKKIILITLMENAL